MRRRWDTTGVSRGRVVYWAVTAAVLVGALLFLVQGANRPLDPSLEAAPLDTATTVARRVPIEGFGEIAFRIGNPVSAASWRCALLAETDQQHGLGLMGQDDLNGYDAMVFRFDADTGSAFFMKDTLIPLSIAWFTARGDFVSAADMEPCGDQPQCPTYSATAKYRYAIEVPKGGLAALGASPGSKLELGGACS